MENYYETLPQCAKDKLYREVIKKSAYMAGKTLMNRAYARFVAKKLANKIVQDSVVSRGLSIIIKESGLLLSIQGIIYEAAKASKRLKNQYPRIYVIMKRHNLDMLYFMIERPLKKYLDAIRISKVHRVMYLSKVKADYCET